MEISEKIYTKKIINSITYNNSKEIKKTIKHKLGYYHFKLKGVEHEINEKYVPILLKQQFADWIITNNIRDYDKPFNPENEDFPEELLE